MPVRAPDHDNTVARAAATPASTGLRTQALFAGAWRAADEWPTFSVADPASGDVVADVHDVAASTADVIMDAARAGFDRWRTTAPRVRGDVLLRAFDLMRQREDELARLITAETGKPLAESLGEVRYSAGYVREYALRAPQVGGRTANADGNAPFYTERVPVGVAVLVTPWNFPLAMGARKIAPALAAGCSVVVKPAQQTPLVMLAFAELLLDAGVPTDAVSVVPTSSSSPMVAAMLDHPATAKLSFTGSTPVGRALARHAGERLLRMSMELGGNAPFVVFADADLDAVVTAAMTAKFRNGGQACTAANRFIVEASVVDRFLAAFGAAASALVSGSGADATTTLGPMITEQAAQGVRALVADAVERGARVAATNGGPDEGAFVPATILADVPADARILHEEIFGPVAPVVAFEGEEDAIARANATPFGLASYVFTGSAARARRVSHALEAGMVGVNTGMVSNPSAPFGGIGDSGFGREGGPEGLDEYLETKYYALGEG